MDRIRRRIRRAHDVVPRIAAQLPARSMCFNARPPDAETCRVTLGRLHARWAGFVVVVLAGVWFEHSPWGARLSSEVLELQLLALDGWSSPSAAGRPAETDTGTAPEGPALRPLSRTMGVSLVVIAALVWWESGRPGWALASSLVALAALFAVSTMMAPRGVLVPIAGPGAAIVAGMLGRRALEAAIAARSRRRRTKA